MALIDRLSIQFGDGLNILTGETGAGKSIIINSLQLILGKRASSDLLRVGYSSGFVEVIFTIPKTSHIFTFLPANGVDISSDGELIIKRQINSSGRSRAWINQCSVTISFLQQVTGYLIDISSQREHDFLLKTENHLKVLDTPTLQKQIKVYQEHYQKWVSLKQQLDELEKEEEENARKLDFYLFQRQEIDEARLLPQEDVELEQQRNKLIHAESLYHVFHVIEDTLYSSHGSAFNQISSVQSELENFSELDKEIAQLYQKSETLCLEMEDFVAAARSYAKSVEVDPDRLKEVEERLSTVINLKKKYGGTLERTFEYRDNLDKWIIDLENLDSQRTDLLQEIEKETSQLISQAQKISTQRKKRAKELGKLVEKELQTLGMKNVTVQIGVSPVPASQGKQIGELTVNKYGIDRVEILISTNKGEELKPLTAIVSGGELSRIMLALKTLVAHTDDVHIFVFDEIDSGIGGQIARAVGEKLSKLALSNQVLCITHLPGVASFAEVHFLVEKEYQNERTTTQITPLNNEKLKTKEIARMIAGNEATPNSLAMASEMIRDARAI